MDSTFDIKDEISGVSFDTGGDEEKNKKNEKKIKMKYSIKSLIIKLIIVNYLSLIYHLQKYL